MQLNELLVAISVLSSLTATPVTAWSPTNGYTPGKVSCPEGTLLRNATGLSQNETEWLKKRSPIAKDALQEFLTRGTVNFSDDSLVKKLFSDDKNVPKVGIAASGGGYRAMLVAAGMVAAMDNRTVGANEHGLGGLLQGSTYLSGLSGGNWLTTTLAWNNWTSVQDILDHMSDTNTSSIWNIENSILSPGGNNQTATNEIFGAITKEINGKIDAGFNATLVDVWGRALSQYFFPNLPEAGAGLTWSTLRDADVFKNGEMPFPISVADGKYPGSTVISSNSTVFEFNPFELGSWDPTLNAFTDVKYLGSNVNNGESIDNGQCIAGFDNTGFIAGTSADIFNLVSSSPQGAMFGGIISSFTKKFLPNATGNDTDIGIYAPNPFKGANTMDQQYSSALSEAESLFLVDGGEDGEGIPFAPLLQKDRDLDVIFALDITDDTKDSWPNGAAMVQTYQRQFTSQGNHSAFPYVPTTEEFIKQGLNKRPTFFGCDAQNLTDLTYIPPLVVYVPNTEYSFPSNTSTFQLNYKLEDRISIIQNGYEAMTMGNFTKDSDFLGCISCAIMRRKQESLDVELPQECEQCFSTYCWNDKSTSQNSTSTATNHNGTWTNSTSATHSGSHNTTLLSSVSASATARAESVSSNSSSKSSSSKSKGAANLLNAKNILGAFALINAIVNLL